MRRLQGIAGIVLSAHHSSSSIRGVRSLSFSVSCCGRGVRPSLPSVAGEGVSVKSPDDDYHGYLAISVLYLDGGRDFTTAAAEYSDRR